MSSSPAPDTARRRPTRSLRTRSPRHWSLRGWSPRHWSPRYWSLRGWSLRARLLAGGALLLAVVCVVIGVVSTLFLRGFLVSQLDNQLTQGIHATANPPSGGGANRPAPGQGGAPLGPPPPGGLLGGGPPGGTAASNGPPVCLNSTAELTMMPFPGLPTGAISGQSADPLDPTGPLLAAVLTSSDCQQKLTAAQTAALAAGTMLDRPYTRSIGALGDYRLVAHEGPRGLLVVGLPLTSVDDTIARLAVILGAVAAAALVAAGLAGTVIIRRTLRPLRRVADTASRVAEMELDRGDVALSVRVPDADTDPNTEVGQVGAALNRMLGHVADALTARQASEMRVRQFVGDASHELRTPLAAIRGYAELTRRSNDEVPPRVAHAIGRVESESARMTVLVNDLLLLARLDSGRPLEREQVDMSRMVVDAVSDAHIAGAGHVWRLDLPPDPVVVTGDTQRLHQVLANLLSNARTHTPPGTTITTGIAEHADHVTLTVADDGPGIPADLLPDVFERFARADTSRSRNAGSTGLGLAIVSAVVTAHRGSVEVSSRPGNTVFTVRLPHHSSTTGAPQG